MQDITTSNLAKVLFIAALSGSLIAQFSYASSSIVKIYNSDESKQCEPKRTALEDVERTLTAEGIKVLSSCRGGDGRLYPAVCGAASGVIYVFEIDVSQLPKAKQLGFRELKELPDSSDSCTGP